MKRTWLVSVIAVVATAVATLSAPARSQGTGRSMDFDVSIRSAGMASAANAVFWGEGLDHWANPALLGYQHGLRYEWGRTQLVPGLAADVKLTSRVLKAGWSGVGVVLSRKPMSSGGVQLDYGVSEGTDPSGNPTGTFNSFEHVDSWGLGVSAAQAFEGIARLAGHEPRALSRFADISVGMNFKKIDIQLAPAALGGVGSTRARDLGGLVRVTPLNFLDRDVAFPAQLDLSYGYSRLSYNDDAVVTFISEDQASRVSRHRRNGFALRLAMDAPETRRWTGAGTTKATLLKGLLPLMTIGMAHDHATVDGGSGSSGYKTDGTGFEIGIANVFAYRHGSYTDKTEEIDGSTSGWSVGLPLGPWAGARYERARFPQSRNSGLPNLTRKAFSAWVDPAAIWRTLHEKK